MEKSAADQARFYKRRHRQKIVSLDIIKTYIDHMRVELIFFPDKDVDELKALITDVENELCLRRSSEELQIEKYKEIIAIEVKRPLEKVEKMVRDHAI